MPSFDAPYTYLITGASRSLGLGYATKLLAAHPNVRIVAAVRNPAGADQLNALAAKEENKGRVLVVQCDVSSEESVKAAADKLASDPFLANGLDAIVANAGIFDGQHNPPSQLSLADLDSNLRTNLYGAIFTVQYFLPLLRKGRGKQIFVVSSLVASFGGSYSQTPMGVTYSISKAAVNMYTVKVGRELGPEGFTVVPFHPGYVKSDMNKFNDGGDITVEAAITQATENVFLKATPADNCRFMVYDGSEMPW
ncbi:hypothetical protein JCM11251_006515 [Rhodosporidiobolus azoricus]